MDTTASTGESSYEARLRTGPKGTAVSGKPAVSEGTFPRARGGRGILELLPARARGDSTLPVAFAACLGLGSLLSLIGSALSINSPVPFIFAPPASAILRLIGSVFFAAAGLLAPALAAVIKSALTQAAVPRFMPRGLARLSERAWPALVGGAGFCLLAANILSTVNGYRARQSLIGHLTSGGKVSTYVPDAVLEKLGGGKAATAASGVLFGSMPLHVAQEALWRVGVVLLAAGLTLKAVYTIPALAPVQWKRVVGKGGLLPGWRHGAAREPEVTGEVIHGEAGVASGVASGVSEAGVRQRGTTGMTREEGRGMGSTSGRPTSPRSKRLLNVYKALDSLAGLLAIVGNLAMPLGALAMAAVPIGGAIAAGIHYARHGSDLPFDWTGRLRPTALAIHLPKLLGRFVEASVRHPFATLQHGIESTAGSVSSHGFSKAEQAIAQGLLPGPGIWLTASNGTLLLGVLCVLASWMMGHAIKFMVKKTMRGSGLVAGLGIMGMPRQRRAGAV